MRGSSHRPSASGSSGSWRSARASARTRSPWPSSALSKARISRNYTARLFQTWRLGQKGLDNGVLLVVSVDDRRTRLEVGYRLEGTLPDAVASAILRQDVAPHFRAGRFAQGIGQALAESTMNHRHRRLPAAASAA